MSEHECVAVANIKGEHVPCDWPTDEHGRHDGWAHSNREHQIIWCGDEGPSDRTSNEAWDAHELSESAVRDALNMAAEYGQLGAFRVLRRIFHPDAWEAALRDGPETTTAPSDPTPSA